MKKQKAAHTRRVDGLTKRNCNTNSLMYGMSFVQVCKQFFVCLLLAIGGFGAVHVVSALAVM